MPKTSQKSKILVVDDIPQNVRLLEISLKAEGYSVISAYSGQEALDKVRTENPDLVLLDIMMPEMDGYETIRRIRQKKEYWNLPIIALTAKVMEMDRNKCIEAGANDYLPKPVDVDRLISLIRIWLYE